MVPHGGAVRPSSLDIPFPRVSPGDRIGEESKSLSPSHLVLRFPPLDVCALRQDVLDFPLSVRVVLDRAPFSFGMSQ